MPAFVVSAIASTKDGSSLGNNPVSVRAANEQEAKEAGASLLGVSPSQVLAKRAYDPWQELM